MPIIPVRGMGSVGIVADTPSVLLSTNAWSDGLNIRFDNDSVQKITGHRQMFDLDFTAHSVGYWARPVTPYYVYADASRIFRVDGAANAATVTRTDADYDTNGVWHSPTIFNGGYTVIMNNGIDAPQYITYGTSGAPQETMFQDLPNWPTGLSAGVVRSAGYALIAGNLTDTSGTTTNFMPGTIRVSSQAAPGGVPASWTPGAALLTTADEFELSQTSPVREFVDLRGYVLAFTETSIHQITLATSNSPTRVQNLNTERGVLSTNCAVEIDGGVFVVDSNDIYVTGGTGGINSVSDQKVRDLFFSRLNMTHASNTFVVKDATNDEVWVVFPTTSSSDGRCDEALIYNYKHNTWTRREMPLSRAGTFGPVSNGTIFENDNREIQFTGYAVSTATTSSDRLHTGNVTNQFNGENFTAYVERESMDMGDLEATKWTGTIYPLVDGSGTITLKAVTSNAYGSTVDFDSRNAYEGDLTIGEDYKLDTRLNGRFTSVRYESTDNNSWRLAGYSLNAEVEDRR